MKNNDKNKLNILVIVILILILLTLIRVNSNSAVDDCIESGNSRDFCESGLLR